MSDRAYRFMNWGLRRVFPVIMKLTIDGLSNVPATGPVVIAINHSSFVEPLLAGAYVKRPIVMMSKAENFDLPIGGWVVKMYGAFPIRRGEADRESIKTALAVLRGGRVLLMAPEGTRSPDGQLQPGHDGLAMLAARTGAAVVPFAVAGGKPVWKNAWRLRRTRVSARAGAPMYLNEFGEKPSREQLAKLTDRVMLRLAELLPPEQRGHYRERVGG
ncbi:MAG: 1-acyl-sn-glycerol-3-phosphate acyltransferase [Chloroflexi bacterium]|nr:1-acyl-sn-glycerol-3-phosphate acyltransferase [Chloroflexota bacterium]